MNIQTVKCDGPGCDQIRRDVNHWFICWRESDRFMIAPWNNSLARELDVLHACGSACVLKLVAAFLGKIE